MPTEAPQQSAVIAIVDGHPMTEVPHDLFIPPDALEILLDSFSGPLDLLLYLIRRQNFDILNIPITLITQQYLHYIELMEHHRMELAAEYLLMAAMLAEIKSRMLLPAQVIDGEEDEDPRMALVRHLQWYECFKEAAQHLEGLPRQERDWFVTQVQTQEVSPIVTPPDVSLDALFAAMLDILKRQDHAIHHQISRETLSVRERMTRILALLNISPLCLLTDAFTLDEGRMGLVVSLLAILELAKEFMITITQAHANAPIYLQAAGHE